MGWKAAQKLIQNWKILRGDNVMIIRGKDKGETGIIKRVKKHIKLGQGHEGGIFSVEAPLHVSNVQVLDPVTGKPCKIGIRYLEDGTKVRVSRGEGASGSIIPRSEILKIRTTPRPTVGNPPIPSISTSGNEQAMLLNTHDYLSSKPHALEYTLLPLRWTS